MHPETLVTFRSHVDPLVLVLTQLAKLSPGLQWFPLDLPKANLGPKHQQWCFPGATKPRRCSAARAALSARGVVVVVVVVEMAAMPDSTWISSEAIIF